MKFRLIKQTLPNGNTRYFTQSQKSDDTGWYLVDGTYSDDEAEATRYFDACMASGVDAVREVIKESP